MKPGKLLPGCAGSWRQPGDRSQRGALTPLLLSGRSLGLWSLAGGLLWLLCWGCHGHTSKPVTRATDGRGEKESAALAQTSDLPRVVIKDFILTGIEEDQGAGIAARFCAEVANTDKLEVICAEDLSQLLQYQQDLINFGACDQEDCLAQMAEKLQARFIIQGSIHKVGEVYLMQASLIDSQLGKVAKRFSKKVSSDRVDDLLDAAGSLAKSIVEVF